MAIGESGRAYSSRGTLKAVDGAIQLWEIPPPALLDRNRLLLSLNVRTGFEWDAATGSKRRLTYSEWRIRQLARLGGPCDVRSWEDLTKKERDAARNPMRPFVASKFRRFFRDVLD
jgi:hypothetical protein